MFNNASYQNTSIFNHLSRNIVFPTLFYDPITLHHNEIAQTGVEIVEITSDDDLNEDLNSNNHNTTSHVYNIIKNNFTPNSASEKIKYIKQEQKINLRGCKSNEAAFDRACTEFYGINCYERDRDSTFPSNQFFSFDTSSSSETQNGLKLTRFSDTSDECWNSDESYNSHKAYDIINNANKTWNYCENDIRYLYRNNESYIIPSQEETSYDNSTDEDEICNSNNINRRATTLPTYMPRLNLPSSPTLPTVTEVFEPSKTPIELADDNDSSSLFQKSVNNWFHDDQEVIIKENKNIKRGNKLSTILEREKRRIKLKEIQEYEQENAQDKHVNLDFKAESCKSLKLIDKTASQTFVNDKDTANELQAIKTIAISPQSTNMSDQKEKNEKNSNGNSNESCVIEVYDCDLNTTPRQNDVLFKKEIIGNNLITKSNSNPSDRCSTNCVPPLHFSFVVESDPESRSCLKRMLTFIRCCKQ